MPIAGSGSPLRGIFFSIMRLPVAAAQRGKQVTADPTQAAISRKSLRSTAAILSRIASLHADFLLVLMFRGGQRVGELLEG
jgi:hypothetical protein